MNLPTNIKKVFLFFLFLFFILMIVFHLTSSNIIGTYEGMIPGKNIKSAKIV
jgi:hypothetical protein